MAKLYIDERALSPIVQALMGQSREAGIASGLQNRMMAAKLDSMRFEQDEKIRQREARDGLLASAVRQMFPNADTRTQENILYQAGGQKPVRGFRYGEDGQPVMGADGVPMADDDYSISDDLRQSANFSSLANTVSKLNMANAYGRDIEDIARGHGRIDQNNYESSLRNNIVQALMSGNRELANQNIQALSGKAYSPYSVNSTGIVLNQATGAYQDTPLSVSNINQNNAAAFANNQRGNLYGVQQDTERAQAQSYLAQAMQREAETQKTMQEASRLTAATIPAPSADVARMFSRDTGEQDPLTRKPIVITDTDYMNAVQRFAIENGISDWGQAKYLYDQNNVNTFWNPAIHRVANSVATPSTQVNTVESTLGIQSGMSKQQIADILQNAARSGKVDRNALRQLAEKYLTD